MSMRAVLLTILVLFMAAVPPLARATPRYSIRVLAGPGSVATGINGNGDVVGQASGGDATHAFLYSGDALTDLGTLGGASSSAAAVNEHGVVVGYADDAEGNMRAFVYASGVMVDLGTLGGSSSSANAINGNGLIAGGASTAVGGDGVLPRAFVYAGGAMQDIVGFPQGDSSVAFGINAAGMVVGRSAISANDPPEHPYHAFVYGNGMALDLGTLGGLYSTALAINEAGIIVGQASTTEEYAGGHFVPHAFVFEGGIMRDLGAFGGAQSASLARAINHRGQIVGVADTASDSRAFLYENGNMLDLNGLVDTRAGWLLTDASGINGLGQIAATGCRDGQCYALRLDVALAEPATWAVWAMGLLLMGRLRGR